VHLGRRAPHILRLLENRRCDDASSCGKPVQCNAIPDHCDVDARLPGHFENRHYDGAVFCGMPGQRSAILDHRGDRIALLPGLPVNMYYCDVAFSFEMRHQCIVIPGHGRCGIVLFGRVRLCDCGCSRRRSRHRRSL
jgi:hypothetical protein